jgi:hypothetical protein
MGASDLQHILNFCVGRDTISLQRWLKKVGESMPVITYEREKMSNLHKEMPGKGVMYWEFEENRKSPSAPDFKGFLILEMDYKAGEKLKIGAWKKPTSRGVDLLSLSEDNWSKKQRETPREVTPSYEKKATFTKPKASDDFSGDVPF